MCCQRVLLEGGNQTMILIISVIAKWEGLCQDFLYEVKNDKGMCTQVIESIITQRKDRDSLFYSSLLQLLILLRRWYISFMVSSDKKKKHTFAVKCLRKIGKVSRSYQGYEARTRPEMLQSLWSINDSTESRNGDEESRTKFRMAFLLRRHTWFSWENDAAGIS